MIMMRLSIYTKNYFLRVKQVLYVIMSIFIMRFIDLLMKYMYIVFSKSKTSDVCLFWDLSICTLIIFVE